MATAKKVKRGRKPSSGPKRVIRVPLGMVACYADDGRLLVCIPRAEWESVIVPVLTRNPSPEDSATPEAGAMVRPWAVHR